VERWPVGFAATGVADAGGVLATTGSTGTAVRIASVTKPIVALTVLVAVEEGTVGLDEAAGPPGSTVRHLLAHTSGLAFDGAGVLAPPGQRRIYSNTGFEVLARHLAGKAAMPFADYLHEAVVEPLGLAATELRGSPAAGVWSTVDDLLAVAREMLRPTLVQAATWLEATTPQFPEVAGVLPGIGRFSPNPWGLGVEIRGTKSPHWTGTANSPRTYGHFGGTGTFLWVDPEARLACVALTDRDFGRWALEAWPAFSDAVLRRHGPAGDLTDPAPAVR
jgi:CubicO group peptidase (beta-lactamase class C family)